MKCTDGRGPGLSLRTVRHTETSLICQVFRRLKGTKQLDKLVGMVGDVSEAGLGLSPSDKARLVDEVSVVFHCAATVRFDIPLQQAIGINVKGTIGIVDLARDLKHLTVSCSVDIGKGLLFGAALLHQPCQQTHSLFLRSSPLRYCRKNSRS